MKLVESKLFNGTSNLGERDTLTELFSAVLDIPGLALGPGVTGEIREQVRASLTRAGWSDEARINTSYDLSVTSLHRDVAFQIQTGNASRAAYDLLKMQYLFVQKRISLAVIAVFTRKAAQMVGSNLASYERIARELELFDEVVTIPILLVGIE